MKIERIYEYKAGNCLRALGTFIHFYLKSTEAVRILMAFILL
jgi:hypothetical protein